MSEFYKKNKRKIQQIYEYFGIAEKIIYGLLVVMIGAIVYYMVIYIENSQSYVSDDDYTLLWFVAVIFVTYKILKWWGGKNSSNRTKAVLKFKEEKDINLCTVESLINEIEKKINNTIKFATWSVGIIVTLLVVTINIVSNAGFKLFDTLDMQEKKYFINDILSQLDNETTKNVYTLLFDFGKDIFFTLCLIVFTAYLGISLFNLVKKEIVSFLYDVRYELQKESFLNNEEMNNKVSDGTGK